MNAPEPDFELLPRDLTPYRAGNTGIPYVHRFESGRPGPHVLINSLTHEFCIISGRQSLIVTETSLR